MDISLFISSRLRFSGKDSFAATVVRIATIGTALGLATLILAFAVMKGFRDNIETRMFSFGAHLRVWHFNPQSEYDVSPVSTSGKFYKTWRQNPLIAQVQSYCLKPALFKTKEEVQGLLLKGIGNDFDYSRFKANLIKGKFNRIGTLVNPAEEVIISQKMANNLSLAVDSSVVVYFMQNPPRARRLKVVGIFETGLEDFDDNIAITDFHLIQSVNQWPDTLVNGFEVFLNQPEILDSAAKQLYRTIDYDLTIQTIKESHFQMFDWLDMVGRNVEILLTLISLVVCFNLISTLLIMLLERTRMIGLLKTFGATNQTISRIFLYNGLKICLSGLFWGNLLGLGLCALQYYFRIMPLDVNNYYISYVPISWPWLSFLGVNLLLLILNFLTLLVPLRLVAGIRPLSAIRFD